MLKLEKDLKVKLTLRDPYCLISSDEQNLVDKAVQHLVTVYRGQAESEQEIKMAAKSIKFKVPGMFYVYFLSHKEHILGRLKVEKARNAMNWKKNSA